MAELQQQVESLHRKFPEDPIIIMGDWNLKSEDMGMVREWSPGMECVEVNGAPRTFHSRGQEEGGDIDHVVIDRNHRWVTGKARVLRDWDLSDHWPIAVSMQAINYQKEAALPKERLKGVPRYYAGAYIQRIRGHG